MRQGKLYMILRSLLGAALLFFGIAGIFQLFDPPKMSGAAMDMMAALMGSGYIMMVMNVFMAVIGLMLLANRWAALGAVLLVPLTLNWVLFHIFLDLPSIFMALVFFALNVYIIMVNMEKYMPMLEAK